MQGTLDTLNLRGFDLGPNCKVTLSSPGDVLKILTKVAGRVARCAAAAAMERRLRRDGTASRFSTPLLGMRTRMNRP